jgi:hypothetical protein
VTDDLLAVFFVADVVGKGRELAAVSAVAAADQRDLPWSLPEPR